MREVQTLRAREHEHIVQLFASWNDWCEESECYLNLLFPYSKMDLRTWLELPEAPKEWMDPKARKDYAYKSVMSLCDAISFLHEDRGGYVTSNQYLKRSNNL